MTLKRRVIPLSLLFSGIFASMVVFTSTARADSKDITINEPVTIGNVVLKPAEYTVTWIGIGPEVQVSFIRGSKTLATATARLISEKNPKGRSVVTGTLPDNSTVLKRISFSSLSLIFDQSGAAANATSGSSVQTRPGVNSSKSRKPRFRSILDRCALWLYGGILGESLTP